MKTSSLLFGLILTAHIGHAQVVGDPTVNTVQFDNNSLLFAGTAQAFPKMLIDGGYSSTVWSTDVSPVFVRHSVLDANYQGTTIDDVFAESGALNSLAQDMGQVVCLDTLTGKMLSVYKHNYNDSNPTLDDFSMKGIIYEDDDFTGTPFNIEGPFGFSSDAPSNPSIAVSSNSIFCVAYHSSLTMGSSSEVRVKFIDANTGVVTPAASGTGQNGISLTFPGAQHPSVAWNETAGVFGITYTVGSGNNQKIRFVSCDETGTVITSQKDLIADNSIQVQYPKLYADGDDFVMTWRDFRQVTIDPHPPVTGIPVVRIGKVDAVGDIISLTGAVDIFDTDDNSLALSNPYSSEFNLYSDLEVIEAGSKYAVTWGTQNVVPSIEFAMVQLNAGEIKSSIPIEIHQDGANSFAPDLAYDEMTEEFVAVYHEFNGTTYENRVCVGIECTLMASAAGTDVTTNGGSDGAITTTVSGETGTVVYDWSNGETTPDVSGLVAGTYSVIITDDSGCENEIEVEITEPGSGGVGIEENVLNLEMFMNSETGFISISGDIDDSFAVVYNLNGQKVKSFYLFDAKSAKLYVDDLESGLYFLKVSNSKGEQELKFTKH